MGPISYTQFKVIANNSMIGDSQQVVLAGNRENPGLVSSVAGGKRRSFATPQDEAKASQFVRSQLMNAVRKQLGKVPDSTALLEEMERAFDEVRNLYANPAVLGTRENEVL